MIFNKLTLPIVLLLLGVLYYFSLNYVYTSATNDLLNQQVETSKNQANLISNLLAEKLRSGFSKEQVKNELQRSIENSSTDYSFICMFDDSGREICHPNKEKIGKLLASNNSFITSISNYEVEKNFKDAILEKKAIGGLRKIENRTEIVYLSPVQNSNWIVASHSNVLKFKIIFKNLKQKLVILFLLVWLSSALLIYFFLQKINRENLKYLTELNRKTGNQYFNELASINKTLHTSTNTKKIRLLADKGTKLTPVFIENIAFIYSENKISYIVEFDNEKSSINSSLEELFKILDNTLFYRASRQVIVSIKAIDKIEKYGSTQLKVITNPIAPIAIIISKAKLTDFKKWVGKN